MAASSSIYEHIHLNKTEFDCFYLEWKIPLSKDESIESYARRMCEDIHHKNPVLIGVSFGGVMVQEMSKIIPSLKTIIISSIKSNTELPKSLKLAQLTKAYRLFPAKFIENLDGYVDYFLNDFQHKKIDAYKKYMPVRNATYLHWAIYTLLHWQQKEPISNIVHIHGTKDGVFPIKTINSCTKIVDGTHAMILTKAKKISALIKENLTFISQDK